MFLKNLQLAFRNLFRDKFYSLLNIFGLTIGMAATLLLFSWVKNEYSYDNFHANEDRLYRIISNDAFGGQRNYQEVMPLPFSEVAKTKIPEIQEISMLWDGWDIVLKVDNFMVESEAARFVEPSFLKIFNFQFIAGNPKTALNNPNSIILTESLAFKLFGNTNVLGENIQVNNQITVVVTGIIKDLSTNTHLTIESLIPLKGNIEQLMEEGSRHWGAYNFHTYALLRPNVNPENVSPKFSDLLPENRRGENETFFELQLVKDIYLGSGKIPQTSRPKGDKKTIGLIGFIGLLLLLIACINYVNLTTARAAHRAKSIGVQKIIGASKGHLFQQHLLEATCIVGLSAILAIALANISLPIFESISGSKLLTANFLSLEAIPIILGTTVLAILLSGIHPAIQLANFKPMMALKGGQFNQAKNGFNHRRILVIGQFTCSAALVIVALIMMQQMDFIKTAKLGYEKKHVFSVYTDPDKTLLMQNELASQVGIEAITLSDQNLVNINSRMGGFTWEGMPEGKVVSIFQIFASDNFRDFFDLQLKEGRWFNEGNKDINSFLINETAVKALQLENPIGKWIDFWGQKGTIVGIIKDFHFKSFHNNIDQLIIRQHPDRFYRTYIKTTGEKAAEAIVTTEKIYKKHHPEKVFQYEFLDETFDNLYKKETRMGNLFSAFAMLTIFISGLGVFGLATYTAERRSKEISIRKVLGASVVNIINLLSLDFLKMVFIALLIASPIAWYFMNDWLTNFAFSIDIHWSVFAITGLLTILLAYFTIGFQSLRAALINPAKKLKTD